MNEEQKTIEEKAKRQGWVPEDEYTGEKEPLSAEDFLKKGDEILAIKNERFKKQEEMLAAASAKIDSMEVTFKKFGEYTKKQQELAEKRHKSEIADLKEQQRQIAEDPGGDMTEFDRIGKKIEIAEAAVTNVPEQKQEGDSPDFPAFQAANPWYNIDVEMTIYANQAGGVIFKKHGAANTAFYNEVAKEVKKKFPDKFKAEGSNKSVADVEGSTGTAYAQKGGKKTYNALPQDAKEACDKFIADSKEWVKSGLLDKPKTKEDFLKDYEWGE